MQISPASWRRHVKPAWRRVSAAVRREFPEARFFLHSCGKIDAIVPDVIELGFDILHPLQPECLDFAAMHREYGKRIALCATISSQRTLPFGAPDDVRREVRRLAAAVGDERRCILTPSNVIQPETPWENVVAFAEEARARESGKDERTEKAELASQAPTFPARRVDQRVGRLRVDDFRFSPSQTSFCPPMRTETVPRRTASVSGPAKSKLDRVVPFPLQAAIHSLWWPIDRGNDFGGRLSRACVSRG